MADNLASAEAMIAAYNAQDFAAMKRQIAPDVDFAHFNRNFVLTSRDELLGVLRQFASDFFVERRFEPAERVIASGDSVVRIGWYAGTCAVDLEGFGKAGETFRFKFCSVLRFDDQGVIVEWKDFG
jgi:ketosteroid isomerase-like protein